MYNFEGIVSLGPSGPPAHLRCLLCLDCHLGFEAGEEIRRLRQDSALLHSACHRHRRLHQDVAVDSSEPILEPLSDKL